MGYSIHIERDPPLTLAEWTAAVDQTTEVRLDTRGCSATNPKTGEVVSIAGSDGDAEVSIEGTWYPCFHWSDGSVSFRASSDFHEPYTPLRRIAQELARRLKAKVVGDEGEEYG